MTGNRSVNILIYGFFFLLFSCIERTCIILEVPQEKYGKNEYRLLNEDQKRDYLLNIKNYDDDTVENIIKHHITDNLTREQMYFTIDPKRIIELPEGKGKDQWITFSEIIRTEGGSEYTFYLFDGFPGRPGDLRIIKKGNEEEWISIITDYNIHIFYFQNGQLKEKKEVIW